MKIYKWIILISILCLFGCTDSDNAYKVLHSQGYTNIEITGYCFFGCGKDDTKSTGFVATAPNGDIVEGVVCQGLFTKGATVRITDIK